MKIKSIVKINKEINDIQTSPYISRELLANLLDEMWKSNHVKITSEDVSVPGYDKQVQYSAEIFVLNPMEFTEAIQILRAIKNTNYEMSFHRNRLLEILTKSS